MKVDHLPAKDIYYAGIASSLFAAAVLSHSAELPIGRYASSRSDFGNQRQKSTKLFSLDLEIF